MPKKNNKKKAIVLYIVKEISSHPTSRHHEPQLEGVSATCSGAGKSIIMQKVIQKSFLQRLVAVGT